MKKLIWIVLGAGLHLTSCSSSSRMGYAHFDDMYEDRPYYTQERRGSQHTYQPAQNQRIIQDDNTPEQGYQDDEVAYGSYEQRIHRFHRNRGQFDYFSPFSTGFSSGFYSGFNQGFNMGINSGWGFNSGFGIGFGFGNLWNRPWYSSSFTFGWGYPWSWNNPFCDPWGWNSPFFDPFWNPWAWNRPIGGWFNPWGSPWGWGNPIIIINNNDYNRNRNLYYGPRGSNFSNSYYNPNMGGRGNAVGTTPSPGVTPRPSVTPNNSGIQMERKDKPTLTFPSNSSTPERTTPDRGIKPQQPISPTPGSRPVPSPTPDRNQFQVPPRGNQIQSPASPGLESTPKFRYSTPKYETPGYQQVPSRGTSPSKPSFNTPGRPSFSSPSSPGRTTSPSISSPSRSTPSVPSPGRSPGNSGGMERRPK